MITIKARNGHIVRCITATEALATLDTGELLYGVAECAVCGVIHGFTCDHPPSKDASDDDLVSHLHHHLVGVVEAFEEELCVPAPEDDAIYDWSTRDTSSTTTAPS